MSKLYFFRHAQASYLAENYDRLSAHGENQSVELGKYLVNKNIAFNKVFVGPLERQRKTFDIVANIFSDNNIAVPAAIIVQEMKEHSGPEAMQLAHPEMIHSHPHIKMLHEDVQSNPSKNKKNSLLAFQYFMDEWAEGKIEVKDIEPWHVFRKEVKKGLDTILENTDRGETIGVFTSGGTISSVTAEALKVNDEKRITAMNFSVRNTSFTTFLYSRAQFNLLSFNEIPHLNDEMITFV